MPRLFVYHPLPLGQLNYAPLCQELATLMELDGAWPDWDVRGYEYDRGNSFSVRDLRSRFGQSPGAVIFIRPVNTRAVADFREKVPTAPVEVVVANTADELLEAAEQTRHGYDRGEPMLPRKWVAAVLLVRWFMKHDYWGSGQSSHSMAYPNLVESSLPDRFRGKAWEVANDLKQADLLVTKKKGNIHKWGLNAAQAVKDQIHALAHAGEVLNPRLRKTLERDPNQESAHLLVEPENATGASNL